MKNPLIQKRDLSIQTDKPNQPYCRFLPAVVLTTSVLALADPSAWAQNYAWDTSPGSANLNTGNWTSGTTPGSGSATPASGSSLYFGTSSQTSPVNNFASGFNIGGLTFNSGASAYTMSGSVAENLTGNITNSSTSLETINFPFALTASSTFVPGGGLTLGGAISGSGSLTVSGSGTLLLSAINTYSGGTTVNGGALQIGGANDGNSRAGSGLLTVNSGATVTVVAQNPLGWNSGATTPSVVINGGTFNGGSYDFSAYNWTLTNGTLTGSGTPGFGLYFNRTPAITSAGTSTISEPLISNQGFTPAVTVSTGVLTISSPINGTGGLALSGSGTLVLAGSASTYSGGTVINGSTLSLGNSGNENVNALGTGTVTVSNNAYLQFSPGGSTSTFAVTNAITLNNGTLLVWDGHQHMTGPVSVGAGGGTLSQYYDTKSLWIDGIVSGSGPLTVNNPNSGGYQPYTGVHFSNPSNTYSGTLTVSGNSVTVDNANALSNATVNVTGGGSSGALQWGSGVTTIVLGGLSGAYGITNGGNALTVGNNNASTTYSGVLSGSGSLTKVGTGTFTLTTNNIYTGGTTVNGGNLSLGYGGAVGTVIGTLTVKNGGTVTATTGNALGYYGTGYQVTTLNIYGGTFTNTASGDQGYGLTVNLMGGTLASGPGDFSMGGGYNINTLATNVPSTIVGTINTRSGNPNNQIPFNVAAGTGAPDLLVGALINNYTAGVGIIKTGAGVMSLTNINTYTGNTLVSGGTLMLSGNNTLDYSTGIIGSSAITVTNGAVLQLNGNDVLGYSSTSPLTVYGTVSKIYNQNETLNRPITLSGGMLTNTLSSSSSAYELFGNYIATAAGTTNWITGPGEFGLRTSSTYFTNAPGSVLDVSAVIVPYTSGCPLNKYGAGTMVLLAANTYNGATIISGGTLALTGSASIANSSLISVTNGASLNVSGLASTFTLASGQILSNNATSTGIFNGNLNTGSGTVFVSYAAGTPAFTVTNGTLTLGNSTVFKVNNTGSVLTPGTYGLIGTANGSAVAGTLPSVTVTGGGITAGTMASLAVSGSQLNLVVSTVPTTNTLALLTGSNPSTYGNSLTFQVTLSPAPTNGETVTFYDGVTALGSGPLTSGVATYITSALAAGPHSITAGYGGDSLYAGSTSGVLPQSVNSTALTITANNTNETYVYGMPAFTGGNGVTYAGFVNGETNSVLGGILSYGGTAQGVTNAGIYTIVPSGLTNAVNTNYTIGYANGALTISQATPVIGLGSSLNPAGYLAGISFSAALPADATGSAIFSSTNGPISTNTLSGGAAGSTSITNLARGVQVVTAVYSGDGNYLPGTNTFNQTITNHPPVAALMVATRTAGFPLEIALSDLATNWTDADGDSVELSAINLTSTNGVTLYPMNLATNLDGSYVITNNAYLGYLPTADVADQISYSISDGQGGTNIGYINIVVVSSVTGTNSITSITGGNPNGLTAYGIPGFTYITERSTNLTDWVEISTNMAATNGLINAADSFSDLGGNAPAEAFYRLLWQP